jgi:hypothetical protein
MYPIMLPGTHNEALRFRDEPAFGKDPDGVVRDWHGTPPDPLGRWFIRILDGIVDRIARLRFHSRDARQLIRPLA